MTDSKALLESSRALKALQRWHRTTGRKLQERGLIAYMNELADCER